VTIAVQGCSPCRVGDVARISLAFSNPGPQRTVELVAVAHVPDGRTPARLVEDDQEVSLAPGESALELVITIPDGIPTGVYFLEAGLLDNRTGLTLGRHSVPVRLDP
jgi:hypothetical protein